MGKNVTRIFDIYEVDTALDNTNENLEVLEDRIESKTRWGTAHYVVLKELDSGKCYGASYEESADGGDRIYAMQNGELKLTELEPVEVKTIKFRPVQA